MKLEGPQNATRKASPPGLWRSYVRRLVNLVLPAACAGFLAGMGYAQTVTSQPVNIGFLAADIGTKTPQTVVAKFALSGYVSSFPPTAAMHYGHDYTMGAGSCTSTGAEAETCSYPITFTPTLPGMRKDALVLSDGANTLATVLVYGVGRGPLAGIQPGVMTQVAAPVLLGDSAVDENGTAYVLSPNNNAVYSVTKAGVVTQLPVTGLNYPHQIAIDGAGTLYFSQETYGSSIVSYRADGVQGKVTIEPPAPYAPCGNAISGENILEYLSSVAVDGAGDIFAVEGICNVIFERKADGSYSTFPIDPGITQPARLAVDDAGDVFISGFTINELTSAGKQTEINTLDGMASSIGNSTGLAVDASGILYDTPYPGELNGVPFNVAELPPTGYSTAELNLSAVGAVNGVGLGSDGTFFLGQYLSLTKVDRSQGALNFGYLNLGVASSAQTVELVNIGNQTLSLSGISLAGDAGFSTQATGSQDCGKATMLAPSAYCQVAVKLTPAHGGISTGSLVFTDNSKDNSGGTQTVSLSGYTNGAYVTASPSPLIFAPQPIDTTSKAQTVTLTNNAVYGSAGIGAPVSDNAVFVPSLNNCGAGISPGATCQLLVTFRPSALGNESGTITASVSGGLAGETVSFGVSGLGIPPPATLNIAETIHVGDALPGLGLGLSLAVAEAIHVTDALPGSGGALPVDIAETIHVSDAFPALGPTVSVAVAEAIHVSDVLPGFGATLPINIGETVHVSDALPGFGLAVSLNVAEAIHVTDALPGFEQTARIAVEETIHVKDVLPALGVSAPVNVAETIHLTDSARVAGNMDRAFSPW